MCYMYDNSSRLGHKPNTQVCYDYGNILGTKSKTANVCYNDDTRFLTQDKTEKECVNYGNRLEHWTK